MLSQEVIAKIRQIELQTRRLLQGSMIGQYNTARKGSGFEFNQLREYQPGDDIRSIDWKSSARSNKLVVKEFIEERTRTIMLVVDISASTLFSSGPHAKKSLIAEVAAILALVADHGKDHVALVLFADDVELVIPAGRGHQHVRLIMQKLFEHQAVGKGTCLRNALNACARLKKSNALVILISDFIDNAYEKELRMASKRYDLIALRCVDKNEQMMPAVGLLSVADPETGEAMVVDLSSAGSEKINKVLGARLHEQTAFFKQCGIDCLDITASDSLVANLIRFFCMRMAC